MQRTFEGSAEKVYNYPGFYAILIDTKIINGVKTRKYHKLGSTQGQVSVYPTQQKAVAVADLAAHRRTALLEG